MVFGPLLVSHATINRRFFSPVSGKDCQIWRKETSTCRNARFGAQKSPSYGFVDSSLGGGAGMDCVTILDTVAQSCTLQLTPCSVTQALLGQTTLRQL
ncbi:hypothetical protein Y032_0202g1787 [Ancylostoma ceylanicum]|uniref:Uncharacterized protein n=1 Tax=Ancylostoma ceylanicum TaxID=53326 RepID=A0A016SN47_9BILA|nr:hypothetical protein Y032_0202g1787 [Ancylostoma ceylanicum]